MPHRRTGPARWLARLLMIAGAALLGLALGARAVALLQSEAGLARFHEIQLAGDTTGDPWRALHPDRSTWSPARVTHWQAALAESVAPPVAVLRIPRLGLEVPVWRGEDEMTLNRGAGQIPGTAGVDGSGNTGIAGHRDGFFRPLEGIGRGDDVELETTAGRQRFTVTQTWIVDPSAVWVLAPTSARSLTLVTCYPFHFVGRAPKRFVVRATARPDAR